MKRTLAIAALLVLSAVFVSQGQLNVSQPSPVNVSQVGGSAISTAASGVAKVGTVGNAGGAFDAATNASAPANVLWQVQAPSTASGAASSTKFVNASGAAVSVKASAGNLYGFCLTNETAAVEYAEFFNSSGAPTLGTTAVVLAIKIPISANVCLDRGALALANFSTGIGFASVTAENGSTPAAVTGGIFYQ